MDPGDLVVQSSRGRPIVRARLHGRPPRHGDLVRLSASPGSEEFTTKQAPDHDLLRQSFGWTCPGAWRAALESDRRQFQGTDRLSGRRRPPGMLERFHHERRNYLIVRREICPGRFRVLMPESLESPSIPSGEFSPGRAWAGNLSHPVAARVPLGSLDERPRTARMRRAGSTLARWRWTRRRRAWSAPGTFTIVRRQIPTSGPQPPAHISNRKPQS